MAAVHIVSGHNLEKSFLAFCRHARRHGCRAPAASGFFEREDYHHLWTGLWMAV
jgi:hypothetical protein